MREWQTRRVLTMPGGPQEYGRAASLAHELQPRRRNVGTARLPCSRSVIRLPWWRDAGDVQPAQRQPGKKEVPNTFSRGSSTSSEYLQMCAQRRSRRRRPWVYCRTPTDRQYRRRGGWSPHLQPLVAPRLGASGSQWHDSVFHRRVASGTLRHVSAKPSGWLDVSAAHLRDVAAGDNPGD